MKRRKSIIIVSLILAFMLAFVACSTNNNNNNSQDNNNNNDVNQNNNNNNKDDANNENDDDDNNDNDNAMETFSFSATLNDLGLKEEGTVAQEAWLEKMEELMGMNIEIDFDYIPGAEYDDKIKILLSSNQLTDFFLLPFIYDYTEMANQGYFLDFAEYDMTNYLSIIDKVKDGRSKLFMDNGMFPAIWQVGLPTVDPDTCPIPLTVPMYNYTVLQEEGLEVPETLDELYNVSKALKEKYPDSYPLNVNYAGVFSVFYAFHTNANLDGAGTLYWDGEEYTFAGLHPEYKKGVEYWNMMLEEGLFDPEYIIDTVDTVKSKMLNEENFMLLNSWRTQPSEYTRASDENIYVSSFIPDNPDYGKAYQTFSTANQYWMTNWTMYSADAETENPELLAQFIDLQFIPEVYEITSWGVEGVTFTVLDDGSKKFVDEFFEAEDPSTVSDKYGLWNDRSGRLNPGLRVIQDNTARAQSFPDKDYTHFGGKYEETDMQQAEYLQKLGWPNEHVPPWYDSPSISLTEEESAITSEILTQLTTYTAQMQSAFISGEMSIEDDWDDFIETFKNSYDLQKVLDIYNKAAERYYESKN